MWGTNSYFNMNSFEIIAFLNGRIIVYNPISKSWEIRVSISIMNEISGISKRRKKSMWAPVKIVKLFQEKVSAYIKRKRKLG